ncbi:MAG TPA: hypothetical protein PLO99_06935 [Chitinophagaceae bacterium]|nr:hypothetical protein [Chitinophagaceae bacterium]HRG91800.1 hypothetical protein [Chitinophagaceae bacterium]
MNRLLISLALCGFVLTASSQKVYFMYIQTDPAQPFYLRMNEKTYSSAASGYLIMPKLKDSTYSFSIGFPGAKGGEYAFAVTIDKKDQGFLLKNFAEKGWGLFNLQTLSVQMPQGAGEKKEQAAVAENKDASDFTNILAKAADDPSLKEKPLPAPKKEEVKTVAVVPVPDKPVIKEEVKTVAVTPVPVDPVVKEEVKTVVEKTEPVVMVPVKEKEVITSPAVMDSAKTATALVTDDKKKALLKEEPPVKKDPDPVITDNPPVTKDSLVAVNEPEKPVIAVKEEIKTDPVPMPVNREETAINYKPSIVTRRSESSTTEGFGLTFIDTEDGGGTDTIRILIPNPRPVVPVPVKEEPKEEKKFLDQPVTADTVKQAEVKKADPVKEEKPLITTGSVTPVKTCTSVAEEADFLRLRKKMAAATSDDGMIAEARKLFKTKCFTTIQVRNLGALFLTDEGRYRFFDAAYPFVSDPVQFGSLESELKDTYYINRFKVMLRQ